MSADVIVSRQNNRIKLSGRKATVMTLNAGKAIDCVLIDASRHGIGMIAFDNLLPETQVVLKFPDQKVLLSLQWCQVLDRPRIGFRYGFKAVDSRVNLTELVVKHGYAAFKVLVVDDDPDVAHLFASMLSERGFGVEVAHSGAEAAAVLDQRKFDLILSDMVMPNGDGHSVVRTASEQKIPVTIVTGNPDACAGLPSSVRVVDKFGLDSGKISDLVASMMAKAS